MKYLKVEGVGRLRLRGGVVGLGSTSRRQGEGEEGIFDPIYAIPISDPTGEAKAMTNLQSDWRWPMLLEFEAETEVMSSVSPFLISIFATIRGLGLLPSVFRLGFGFGFFFFFFGVSMARGFAIICWACHMLFFFFRLVLLSHLLFRIDVGFGQWACFVTFFFFFSSNFSLNFFFFWVLIFAWK